MSAENVALVQQAWEAWERHDLDGALSLYAPDVEWDMRETRVSPGLRVYTGPAGVREFMREFAFGAFEDYWAHAADIEDLGGEHVLVRVDHGGRGRGSGVPVASTHWQLYTMRDGKATRVRGFHSREQAQEAVLSSPADPYPGRS